MIENATITCKILQVNGKFYLMATVIAQGYFSIVTSEPEAVTTIPLTAKDIKDAYPMGLLPE